MSADFKQLPLEVASRDGRARRTVIAALEAVVEDWPATEATVGRIIREQTGLRSTERRFVGETVWGIVRRMEGLRRLAETFDLPNAQHSGDVHSADVENPAGTAPATESSAPSPTAASTSATPSAIGDEAHRRTLLMYFLYLVLERGLGADTAKPFLVEAGLPTDVETWSTRWEALLRDTDPLTAAALRHGVPPWVEEALQAAYGAEAAPLLEAMNQRAPLTLRVNIARVDRDTARAALAAEGVTTESTRFSPWGLQVTGNINVHAMGAYRDGRVDVQDEGSQLLALLTDAKPGERVADVCAGGGGKLVALAAMLGTPSGLLMAMDVSRARLDAAMKRMTRLGFDPVKRTLLPRPGSGGADPLAEQAGAYSRVLVDAPCSGTGAWRRHPAQRWCLQAADVAELIETQRSILTTAAALVALGGRLVYATCSILPSENEAQAAWFAARHPEFRLVSLNEAFPALAAALGDEDAPFLRTFPHRHGMDGFFGAIFAKQS